MKRDGSGHHFPVFFESSEPRIFDCVDFSEIWGNHSFDRVRPADGRGTHDGSETPKFGKRIKSAPILIRMRASPCCNAATLWPVCQSSVELRGLVAVARRRRRHGVWVLLPGGDDTTQQQ